MNPTLSDLLQTLPPERTDSLLPDIRQLLQQSNRTLFVLDDDPTGTQTVYDTPVLTSWSTKAIHDEWDRGHRLIYILTNSRSLSEPAARELATEIGRNLKSVADARNARFSVVSRSDSTLRGHYPAEVDALAAAIGLPQAPQLIMPYFLQGGRLTINDVHYVQEGDELIPAARTPFAKDAAFGFRNSNLREWVVEKQKGRISLEQVHCLSLEELRTQSSDVIADRLAALAPGSVCCINAVTMTDVEAFVAGLLKAQNGGSEFVLRTAASFVQSYAGLDQKPLLDPARMVDHSVPAGLIVVGSYVPKTTAQLAHLQQHAEDLEAVELSVEDIFETGPAAVVAATVERIERQLQSGRNVVLHTSRKLKTGSDAEASLQIGNRISDTLVEVVKAVRSPLRFLIAKGGITSSDVATQALGVQRAIVLGQILPGIPVWKTQQESSRPGLSYVVFPGNVGDDAALLEAYRKLKS